MKKNIYIFYALAFLQGLVFYSSIATIYRTSHGLTLYEFGIIESCFSLFTILFEVPWGIICDHIGYKKTMIIANGFYFLSKIIFWKANNFLFFLLERFLLAIAISGLSGCDTSLLYLSTNHDETTNVFGKVSMLGTAGMVSASICFTAILHSDMNLAAFVTIIPFFISFALTFFLQDIPHETKDVFSISQVSKQIVQCKDVFLLLLSSVLLIETTHTLTIFYSQLQYERVGIPLEYYGMIFIFLQLLGLTSGCLGTLTKHVIKEKIANLLYIIAAISSLGLFFSETIFSTILLLTFLSFSETLYLPIRDLLQNECIKTTSRATMLSIYSLIMNFMTIFTNYSFGVVSNISLPYAYLLAFFYCIIGAILFRYWNNHHAH